MFAGSFYSSPPQQVLTDPATVSCAPLLADWTVRGILGGAPW